MSIRYKVTGKTPSEFARWMRQDVEKRKRATIARLDLALRSAFVDSQQAVHVHTGDLKASGRVESDFDSLRNRWSGTLEYGGPTSEGGAGRSLFWEMEKGGEHNPLHRAPLYDEMMRQAFDGGMTE